MNYNTCWDILQVLLQHNLLANFKGWCIIKNVTENAKKLNLQQVMSKVKVNLLSDDEKEQIKEHHLNLEIAEQPPHRKRRRRYDMKKIIASIIIVAVIGLAVFSSSVVFSDENLIRNLSKLNLLQQVGRLIGAGNKDLAGENEDRINVLLIGMGGKGHEGGTLADTIILGSFKPSANQVAMMSVPRDLSIVGAGYSGIKVNAINAYAEKKAERSGGQETARTFSEILDIPIHYYVTVDFSGFERLIDEFGGVDVEVENDLIDYEYPIRGKEYVFPIANRYEVLSIKRGWQHFDGATALKYARSRHALGVEGSDFARSRRQQKILAAMKDKVFNVETFLNPKKINSLLTAYNEHIYTNLEIWQILRLVEMGKDVDTAKIISHPLSDAPDGFLHSQIVNGAYMLLPNDGNYGEIKNLWQNIFSLAGSQILSDAKNTYWQNQATITEEEIATTTEPTDEEKLTLPEFETVVDYKTESATIDIRNGTWTNGYAGVQKTALENKGLKVINAGNADNHEYAETMIYDLSGGKNPGTSTELAKIYGVTPKTALPVTLTSDADFLIILGQ